MTDDLDDLRAAMDAATPRPDVARRAENIAQAQRNFAVRQGSRDAARPTTVTGPSGLWTGVRHMMTALTRKGGLTATTALVAVGLVMVMPGMQDVLRAPSAVQTTVSEADARVETRGVIADQPSEIAKENPAAADAEFADDTAAVKGAPRAMADAGGGADGALESEAQPEALMTQESAEEMIMEPSVVLVEPSPAPPVALRATQSLPEGGLTTPNTEAFPEIVPNGLKITAEEPVSTFSIDVDTASYSVVRSSLMRGQLPPAQAVRVEEMINYFPYAYPAPDAGDAPFRPTVTTFRTPWNADTQLVHIALQGQMPAVDARPPLNLVFLIDTSGSMNDPAKLPLLQQSFRLMLGQLRPDDQVAIVTYAGSAGQVLAPTAASDRPAILAALDRLSAGGGTNGQGGLEQAYAVAEGMTEAGEVNRIILATDGDFNVGVSDPGGLTDYIAGKRDSGTYLSVLGFGRGNLDDATMQALAQNGNGTAAYIDTLSEAQKMLVDQLSGALFPIAGDVKVQVEFNPARIAEYRLIGYETRALRREDFNNDAVDAGELGAGHSVTAIYEVTPVGSPAQLSDPLRYAPNAVAATSDELGFLKLRYKAPGDEVSQLIETPILSGGTPGTEAQFAAAIAGFGQLLRGSAYLNGWGYDQAIALAAANRGDDPFGYRAEAVQLMRLAQSLSE